MLQQGHQDVIDMKFQRETADRNAEVSKKLPRTSSEILEPLPHFKSIKRDMVYKRDFFGERYCRVTSLIQSQEESGRTSFSREAPVGLAQPQFQCPRAFVASPYLSVEAPCTMVPRHFDHTLRHLCLLFCCPNYLITPQS